MGMLEHTKEKLDIRHLSFVVGTFLRPLPNCEVLKDRGPSVGLSKWKRTETHSGWLKCKGGCASDN